MVAAPGTLVRVGSLCKRFGTAVALDDVSFTIRATEALGLICPRTA